MESRPNPATLDVDIADTGERQLRLVGSFPEARLVFEEGTENQCVRRGYPSRMSVMDVRHGLFRRFACRRFVGRRMDNSIVRLGSVHYLCRGGGRSNPRSIPKNIFDPPPPK